MLARCLTIVILNKNDTYYLKRQYLGESCHSPNATNFTVRTRHCRVPTVALIFEEISTSRFTIDHIKPRSLGGTDDVNNLALACSRCNQRRYNFTAGSDLETQAEVPLFNPRTQEWKEHFMWKRDGRKIMGITPIGRATCDRLDANDERYQGERSIQEARALWIKAGCHPPSNDPKQIE